MTFLVHFQDDSWSITDAKLYDALPETMSRDQVWDLLHHVEEAGPTEPDDLIPFVERPMTAAYFEDLKAGRLSSEQVARAIAGDLAALRGGDTHDS